MLDLLTGAVGKFTIPLLAIGTVIAIFKAVQRYQEKQIETVQANAEAYADAAKSIDNYKDETESLVKSINSGTLSSDELYQARLRLKEIEGELSKEYKSDYSKMFTGEIEGLSLLTANIEQVKQAYENLAVARANAFYQENKDQIDKAFDEMTKDRSFRFGDILDVAPSEIKSQIIEIAKLYDNIRLDEGVVEGTLETTSIEITGTVTEVQDTLEKFSADLEAAGIDVGTYFYNAQGVMSDFGSAAADVSGKVAVIIDENGSQYTEGLNAFIQKTPKYKSALNDLKEAQNSYTDAVTGNYDTDQERADAISEAYDKIVEAEEKVASIDFSKDGDAGAAVEQYFSGIVKSLKDGSKNLRIEMDAASAVTGEGLTDNMAIILNSLKKLGDDSGNLFASDILNIGLDYENWKNSTEPLTQQQAAYISLKTAADSYGVSVEGLLNILSNYGIVIASNSKLLGDATKAYTSATGELESVNSIIGEQAAGKSISLDAYNSLIAISSEYADCLENEGGVMQLNTEMVRTLAKTRAEEKLATVEANKAHAQEKYFENAKKIERYNERIALLTGLQEDEAQSLQETVARLTEENSALDADIDKYNIMAAAIREAISARQAWLNAQNGPQLDEGLGDAADALKHINEVLNGNTPTRGDIGSEKYKAALDFVIPEDVPRDDKAAINKYMRQLKQLLKTDGSGNVVDINLGNITKKLETAGFLLKQPDGSFLLKEGANLEEFADILQVTTDMARILVDMLNLNGANINLEEPKAELDTLTSKAERATIALEKLKKVQQSYGQRSGMGLTVDDLDIKIDFDDIEETSDKIDAMNKSLDKASYLAKKFGANSDMGQAAADIIDYVVEQKKLLNFEEFFSVDTSQLSGDLQSAFSEFEKFIDIQSQLEALELKGLGDSEEAASLRKELQGVVDTISQIDPSLLEGLNIDADNVNVDSITTALEGLTSEVMLNVGVPEGAIRGIQDEIKGVEGNEVEIKVYETGVQEVKKSISSIQGKTVYIDIIERRSSEGEDGTQGVNGTAHLSGTARVTGDWGTAKPGRTLVGELGREIVVNPHTGRWYTVGDNGAEFVDIPGGAIIFNHIQSRHLLENGYITSRGNAMASGTAAYTGMNGSIPGSIVNNGGSRGSAIYSSGAGGAVVIPIQPGFTTSSKSYSFEDMYNWHQHILAMEQESYQEYLEWLDKAFREAYDRGEYEHDDFYKYEEEVFEGLKELFEDNLKDIEFQIDSLLRGDGNEKEIINLYNQMIIDIDKQIEAARQRGLGDNDEYIQELLGQRYDYEDEIADLQDEATDNAKDAVKDLVDYRIDMLKKELENERDNLNDRLSEIKDFYDEQKELLQDVYDEEKYLEDQKEKRKAKSDIEEELARLEFDDSAWAQKRKLELQEELEEANKDLADFEKDKALENAQDMFDKLYEKQEEQIQSEIDAIEDKLNDPNALYNQALKDIQNNTLALYEEMVEYNNKYQTGNPEDVKEMWDEAKASLDAFLSTFGHAYKDIVLVPSPSGYASGTSNATPGIHAIDELGEEYVFTSNDGTRYRMFSGGEKVLNAKATNFLYNFATSGGSALVSIFEKLVRTSIPNKIDSSSHVSEINMGDIIIQGNTNENTVSEIRRAKRNEMQWILKEFNKMNKR